MWTVTCPEYRQLVVLGEPGSGKATALQLSRREYALAAELDPTVPLPVLVSLGGYSGEESALEYVTHRAASLGRHLPAYLRAGRIVLLLDALNEMLQRDYLDRVKRIQVLLARFPTVQVIISCRALDYTETLKLQKLEIKPLDVDRQREYLHRYLGRADSDVLFWRLVGGEDVEALWRTWGHRLAAGKTFGMPRRCRERSERKRRSCTMPVGETCAPASWRRYCR